MVCDRVHFSFNAPIAILQPLSIMGLGYRWSLDFVGPFHITKHHYNYVLVMIEHFSKWIEFVALLGKFTERVAYIFLDQVHSRFGAPADVLIKQGRDFLGEFQTLLEAAYTDHRTTPRDDLKTDGLTKRMVQIVKRALSKYGL